MILIKKEEVPQCLLDKQKDAVEKNLNSAEAYELLSKNEKEIILDRLMRDQGHLCAYCMRRLPDARVPKEDLEDIHPVTIEHWFPRKPKDGQEIGQGLDYTNLLAVCSGGRKRRRPGQPRAGNGTLTCDAKRKDSYPQLTLMPCRQETLESLYYDDECRLCSDNPSTTDDIEVKLNLNCKKDMLDLPKIRESVLSGLQSMIPDDENEALVFCQKVLTDYENETDPKTEYVGILIWWLKRYIASCKTE